MLLQDPTKTFAVRSILSTCNLHDHWSSTDWPALAFYEYTHQIFPVCPKTMHLYLSLGNLGFRGASKVFGLWNTVLYLGFRDCLHVLRLTAFAAFKAFALDLSPVFPATRTAATLTKRSRVSFSDTAEVLRGINQRLRLGAMQQQRNMQGHTFWCHCCSLRPPR